MISTALDRRPSVGGGGPAIPYRDTAGRPDAPNRGEVSNRALAMYRMSHER
jgi:hypothetical protein